jgi:hypothetical protein
VYLAKFRPVRKIYFTDYGTAKLYPLSPLGSSFFSGLMHLPWCNSAEVVFPDKS